MHVSWLNRWVNALNCFLRVRLPTILKQQAYLGPGEAQRLHFSGDVVNISDECQLRLYQTSELLWFLSLPCWGFQICIFLSLCTYIYSYIYFFFYLNGNIPSGMSRRLYRRRIVKIVSVTGGVWGVCGCAVCAPSPILSHSFYRLS